MEDDLTSRGGSRICRAIAWGTLLEKSLALLNGKPAIFLLLALLAALVLVGHQTLPPMDRDEARFAQASKQMIESGDYVTVRFQDELRAKKPAGIYWLQATAAKLFGADKIAAYRVPSLIGLLAAIWGTYQLGRQLYRHKRALLSAALLGTGLVVFAEGHLAKTDAMLMALCLGQQLALMRIYVAQQLNQAPPARGWLLFWGFMGAGIMVKGPVAPALAITTIAALCLWDRAYGWLRHLHLIRGLLVVAALTLPWAILVTLATDGAFLDIAIKGDFLAKVEAGQESHGAPIGTYALLIGLLIWPAGLLLPRAVTQLPTLFAHAQSRFLLAWVVPFWILIEIIPTKLPHYPLPLFPALAVLLVCAVNVPLAGNARSRKLGQRLRHFLTLGSEYVMLAMSFALAGFVLWAAMTFGGATIGSALTFASIAALFCGLAIWQGLIWHRFGGIKPMAWLLVAGALFHFTVLSGLAPSLSRIHVSRAIDAVITGQMGRPAAIAASGFHEPSLVFLLGRDLLLVDGAEAALFLAEAPGGLALVEARQNPAFLEMAQSLKLKLTPAIQIEGFNISKGDDVLILMYRAMTE